MTVFPQSPGIGRWNVGYCRIVELYLSCGYFVGGVDGFVEERELNRQSIHSVCLGRAMPRVHSDVLVASRRKVVGNVVVLGIRG